MRSLCFLPCELTARDFASRAAIANELVRRGRAVILGQIWSIYSNIPFLEGCLLCSTMNSHHAPKLQKCKEAGVVVLGCDQEALPLTGEGSLANLAAASVRHCELFLSSSESHDQAVRQAFPDVTTRLVGDPRIDIIRDATFKPPIAEPYILINTGFGLVNSVWGDAKTALSVLLAGGNIAAGEIEQRIAFEKATLDQTIALVRWCAQNLPYITVVRPHPSERAEAWHELAGPKVRIVAGQAAAPWISHAKLLIHSNSTTGLEAAVMGTPCLNLCPPEFDAWSAQFRNANRKVSSAQAAVDAIIGAWPDLKRVGTNEPLSFPKNSVQRIADVMTEHCPAGVPSELRWATVGRTQRQRDKFTVPEQEFVAAVQGRVKMLDDSVALIAP
jgi:surface carbohydrate biosynthesis protein